MTVTVLASAKGSPGATTTSLALTARWPDHREPLLVEADPAGGDVVVRLAPFDPEAEGLRDSPSTVQLAAFARAGLSQQALLEHLQRLPGPGEVRALVGPSSAFAASTAIRSLVGAGLVDRLVDLDHVDVVVDAGRLDALSPALPLATRADVLALVMRPTVESVLHTRALVTALRSMGSAASLLVVGDRPYGADEIATAVDAPVLGVLPDDPIGARGLAGEPVGSKVLARSALLAVAAELGRHLAPPFVPALAESEPVAADETDSTWVAF